MYKILKTFLLLFTISIHSMMNAQQTPPPPPGGAPPGFALPAVIFLAIAALGLGIFKHINNPKK